MEIIEYGLCAIGLQLFGIVVALFRIDATLRALRKDD